MLISDPALIEFIQVSLQFDQWRCLGWRWGFKLGLELSLQQRHADHGGKKSSAQFSRIDETDS